MKVKILSVATLGVLGASAVVILLLFYLNVQLWGKLSWEQSLNRDLQAVNTSLQDQLAQANGQLESSRQKLVENYQRQADTENIYRNTALIAKLSLATVRVQTLMENTYSWSSGLDVSLSLCHGGIIRHGKKYLIITAAHCVSAQSKFDRGVKISEVKISLSQQINGNSFGFADDLSFNVPIEAVVKFEEIDLAVIPVTFKNLGSINPRYIKEVALPLANTAINRLDPVVGTRRFEDDGQNIITPTVMLIDGIVEKPYQYYYQLLGNAVPGESGSIAVNINGEIVGIISARSNNVLNVMLVGFNSIKSRLNRL